MAGELRAKLVAENRKAFGVNNTDPSSAASHAAAGHVAGAGGHGPLHEALAKEAAAGKTIDKTLEPHTHKLVKTGKYLTRTGTSTMAKSLMADETGKALGKALTKSGAQKVAGKVLTQVGGKLLPVVGQYDLAATTLNLANKANDTSIATEQKKYDAGKQDFQYGDPEMEFANVLDYKRPKDSPLKGKELPTFGGKLVQAVEAPLRGKTAIDLAKNYPEYASRPSSRGPSGYGRLNQQ
jgi:hypothetical protein